MSRSIFSKQWMAGTLAALMLFVATTSAYAATSVYPDGPDDGDNTYENSNGLFSENRQLDYDFIFSIFDEYIPLLLPTWNSGGTPLWTTVTHQENPKLYGPYDNDNNGINDIDHFDALGAVVNGGAAAATGVAPADITAIQNAFNTNRTAVKTRELIIPRAKITAFGFLNFWPENIRTGANLSVAGNNIYVPSLWTEKEILNSGNGVNGTTTDPTKKGLLGDSAGMLEVVLRDYLAGAMTLCPGTGSNELVHLQSFMQVFITEFMKTALPGILANAGTVVARAGNNYNTFDIDLDVTTTSVGTIRVQISGVNTGGGAQFIQQGIAHFKNSFSPTPPSTTWTGVGSFGGIGAPTGVPTAPPAWPAPSFICLSGAGSLAASGNLNRAGTTNAATYVAAGENRQTFMQNEGITVKPLQITGFPTTINGFAGQTLTIGDDEFSIIAGDGTAKAYDWETVDTDTGSVAFTTYEHTDPVLGGATGNATYVFSPASLGDTGKKITMQVADDTWTRIVPSMVLNITDPPPTVSSISVQNAQTIRVTFSEGVVAGATTVTNYVLSGTGKGSFTNSPNSVANVGGGVVDLTWNAPLEMFNGGNLTVTVSNVQDSGGQTVSAPNSASCTGCAIGTAPTVVSVVSQNPGPTNAATINYLVTFSESVVGPANGNFSVGVVSGSAAASVTGTVGTGSTRTVTMGGPITGTGQLRLNLSTAAGITDAAGNVLSNTLNGGISTVDRDAPAAPTGLDLDVTSDSNINNDDVTNDNTPTINGNREANTSVQLTSSISGSIGTVAIGSGAWSITTATLPDGVHTITATSTDAAGNVSLASLPLVVTIDTVAPAVPSVPDLLAGSDTGTSNSDNITNLTTLDFQGTRENNSSVQLTSNNAGTFPVTSIGSGAWSVTGTGLAANVVHNVRATARDLAGNQSAQSSALPVTVDTAAPTVQSTNPAAGANVAVLTQVEITFNETVLNVVAGDLTVSASVTPASGVSGSGAGPYIFTVANPADDPTLPIAIGSGAIVDTAGNAFAGDSYTVNKNNAAVTVTLTATGLTSGGITNQSSIAFTATFSQDVNGFVAGDVTRTGANLNTFVQVTPSVYTFNIVPVAPQGAKSVSIAASVATAAAFPFNANSASTAFTFTFDSIGPAVLSFLPTTPSPTNADTIVYTVQFNGPVVDFDDPTDIIVFPNGTLSVAGFDIIPNSTSLYTVEFTGVTGDGLLLPQIIAGAAQDAANNSSGAALGTAIVVDNTPPGLEVDSLATSDSTPPLTGTILTVDDANTPVTVTVNGQVNSAFVDTQDWSLADNTLLTLPDGVYDVQVTATDAAGNIGFDATTNELIVDANPPIITLTGLSFISVNCGDGYVEEGFSAFDAVDLDVTGDVVVSQSIPFNTPPGLYVIEYSVSDTAGNLATETRTVEVIDNCPLAVTAVGDTFFDLNGGDSVTLEIAVTGAIGSTTIQWYRDQGSKAPQLLVGEDQLTLELNNVGGAQNADFYAVVSDDVTSVTSPTFTLDVFVQTPAAGLAGIALLSALAAASGAATLRRRK